MKGGILRGKVEPRGLRQIANQSVDVTEVVVDLFVFKQLAFFCFAQLIGFLFIEQLVDSFLHRGGSAKDNDALFEFEVNRAIAQQAFRQMIQFRNC